jgi:hypothetical protein
MVHQLMIIGPKINESENSFVLVLVLSATVLVLVIERRIDKFLFRTVLIATVDDPEQFTKVLHQPLELNPRVPRCPPGSRRHTDRPRRPLPMVID